MVTEPLARFVARASASPPQSSSCANTVGRVGVRSASSVATRARTASRSAPDTDSPSVALPADTDLPVDGLDPFVTPNSDFYRIDTALVVPQVSKDSWSLKIGGMVDDPIELNYDFNLDLPALAVGRLPAGSLGDVRQITNQEVLRALEDEFRARYRVSPGMVEAGLMAAARADAGRYVSGLPG